MHCFATIMTCVWCLFTSLLVFAGVIVGIGFLIGDTAVPVGAIGMALTLPMFPYGELLSCYHTVGLSCQSDLDCSHGQICGPHKLCFCAPGSCLRDGKCVEWEYPTEPVTKPKEVVDKVQCPILAAMYNAGHLKPDEDGWVSKKHLQSALYEHIGLDKLSAAVNSLGVAAFRKTDKNMNDWRLESVLTGSILGDIQWWLGFRKSAAHRERYLNLFTQFESKHTQHGWSSGTREDAGSDPNNVCGGIFPCQRRFDEFYASFANPQGRVYFEELHRILCHMKQFGDRRSLFSHAPTAFGQDWQGTLATTAMFQFFGHLEDDGRLYMTVDDLRELLVEGRYPKAWKIRTGGELSTILQSDNPDWFGLHGLDCSGDSVKTEL